MDTLLEKKGHRIFEKRYVTTKLAVIRDGKYIRYNFNKDSLNLHTIDVCQKKDHDFWRSYRKTYENSLHHTQPEWTDLLLCCSGLEMVDYNSQRFSTFPATICQNVTYNKIGKVRLMARNMGCRMELRSIDHLCKCKERYHPHPTPTPSKTKKVRFVPRPTTSRVPTTRHT